MGKVFTLISGGPCGSDMTSPYRVQLNGKVTVQEFINAVRSNSNDWGHISVRNKKGATLLNIGYRHGALPELQRLEPKIKKYAECTVIKAAASGGWSRMDYILTIKE